MNWTKGLMMVSMAACAVTASAVNWTGTNLKNYAVTNSTGVLVVLGTEGSWSNGGNTKEKVFDGDTSTFVDPSADIAWAGYQLQAPKIITRIRYYGRANYPTRMKGCLFQGANTADFSDAVTLHVANPPMDWNANGGSNLSWVDVTLDGSIPVQSFTYVRIINPNKIGNYGVCCGNAAEVEFYGVDATVLDGLTAMMSAPTLSTTALINGHFNYQLSADDNAMYYELQALPTGESEWTTVDKAWFASGTLQHCATAKSFYTDTEFRVRAGNPAGTSSWTSSGVMTGYPFVSGTMYSNQTNSWNFLGNTFDKAFDGNIFTYFDPLNGNGKWCGMDLGGSRTITGVRYLARDGNDAKRMIGCVFQVANKWDFSDAVTVYTVPSGTTPSSSVITTVTFDTPTSGRYVRFSDPDTHYMNTKEIEFDAGFLDPPASLKAVPYNLTNHTIAVSWSESTSISCNSTLVYRATAPGGPFTCVTPNGIVKTTTTWEDMTAVAGILYYYKAQFISNSGAASEYSDYASFRTGELLERDWADMTQVKSGVSIICNGTPWKPDATTDTSRWAAPRAFDNDTGTYIDIEPGNCLIGVDLGSANHIAFFRVYPRTPSSNIARLNGAVLYGSNDPDYVDIKTAVAPPVICDSEAWFSVCATNTAPYRYFYLSRSDWYCNLSELQFYGWAAGSAADNVLIAPSDITVTHKPDGISLSWKAGANAVSYTVERQKSGETAWTTVVTGVAGLTADDTSVTMDGSVYHYRIASVRDTELAYSDTISDIPYAAGSGTGLYAVYSTNYWPSFNVNEAVVTTKTDPTINFDVGSGNLIAGDDNTADHVGVVWSGKLIVPYTGVYKFISTQDDGFALRIDGTFIINKWTANNATPYGLTTLTAGEHNIRVDYFEFTGNAYASLKWSGAVTEAIIPSTQFIPVAPDDSVPSPWEGERTFGESYKGQMIYDADSNSYAITGGNTDLWAANEGMEFLWRRMTGSFDFIAKVDSSKAVNDIGAKAMLVAKNSLTNSEPFIAGSSLHESRRGVTWGGKICTTPQGGVGDLIVWPEETNRVTSFWMRLRRRKNVFTFDRRIEDSGTWQNVCSYTNDTGTFNDTLYVGPAVTAANTATNLSTIIFSNIKLVPNSDGTVLKLK